MIIKYVDKEELKPGAFGNCYGRGKDAVVRIRKDLPGRIKKFLLVHEKYHACDYLDDGWIWRELRANWAGAKKEPLGAFLTLLFSFRWERLKFYWKKISGGTR